MRLDKYLKVSRIIKRRPIAKEVADKGRIKVNGILAKSSTDLKINDEVVGGIYSIWTLIDIEKRRIVRPQKVGITIPECEEYSSFVEKYEPLLDIETQKVQTREVMYSDIDLNKHMNNARYLEWVMDFLPQNVLEKYFIGEMTMHYQKEIAPESIVDLYYGQEDDHFKIEFKIAEQIHFVISGRFKEKKE